MKRFWLLFSQAVTLMLAALFVLSTFKPQWVMKLTGAGSSGVVSIRESNPNANNGAAPLLVGNVPPPAQLSYSAAAKKAMPSVVSISTTKNIRNPYANDPWFRFFYGDRSTQQQGGLGSGVIVSSEGYVLTNNHVVEGVDEIEVQLVDGRKIEGKVVGTDPESDLAVVKLQLKGVNANALTSTAPITLGSTDKAQVGDVVLAIGNPFGVGQTVTLGIVSALGRSDLGINVFENFIQTDAAINPGNSGGALVDVNGNLIGINTAIFSRSGGSLGIGFAIPVSTAKIVMEQILATGQVVRGYIGVETQPLNPELAESFGLPKGQDKGLVVAGIVQGGPADKAGLRPGDVVISINDKTLLTQNDLLYTVANLKPDQTAQLSILRAGTPKQLAVQIGKRPWKQPRVGLNQGLH
jgi:serine protease DegQ